MSKAVCLLSGGLDSTTCLALAIKENDEVFALSFNYGQRHEKELISAESVCFYYGVPQQVVDIPKELFSGAISALIPFSPVSMPHLSYKEIAEGQGPSPTVVPFRNAIFLSFAAALAVTNGAHKVYGGMHAEDARGWAYPDCTPSFLGAFAAAVNIGTYREVDLVIPFQWKMKKDIVELGKELGVPFGLTWSCYEGREKHCGKCPTCVERLEAFSASHCKDPVEYEIELKGASHDA